MYAMYVCLKWTEILHRASLQRVIELVNIDSETQGSDPKDSICTHFQFHVSSIDDVWPEE